MKKSLLLQMIISISIVILSSSVIYASSDCDIGNFETCTEPVCQSGCQSPCGQSCPSCCKPNRFCICICDTLRHVRLPTTVVYTAPESVYGTTGPSGFAAEQITLGNYAMVGLNPSWILRVAYGVQNCGCYPQQPRVVSGAGGTATKVDSIDDHDWLLNKEGGYLEMAPEYKQNVVKAATRSVVDERLFSTTYTYTYRSVNDQGNITPEQLLWSRSAYSNNCKPLTRDGYLEATPQYPDVYDTFGNFLNRYEASTYDDWSEIPGKTSDNEYFDSDDCSDTVTSFDNRQVYFLWEEFTCCVIKNQVQDCN